ncbi:hypothetical protein HYE59_08110 [Aggregatibacter actinomycetemcomitans]|uniref:HEPN domain-containing protein n=1 Tax=Aggregatibacter actinomycetemcomitans TaxID=714 RepID=UPI00197B91EA|nr:HEPN domain-containing protein [Aggregatibacter actinomycetemcomitans]MBN6077491.1 hypothetical protein [Aggregatibacter actinomycetemcomitans]
MLQTANTLQLTRYYKENRNNFNENFRLKIHRALSWLNSANELENLDYKFITQWIAFNAAYANEISSISGDRNTFFEFLKKVCDLDEEEKIHSVIWNAYSEPFEKLLDTPYTFQPFWDFYNGKRSESDWERMFHGAKRKAQFALKNKETHVVLQIIFSHLYTLRNQILHGGSTFNSSANRTQLKESCDLLGALIPIILDIMMKNHCEMDWGKPFYPYIQD